MVITSILFGYAVLGSIAGSQHEGTFNVYRRATTVLSLAQLALYLLGVITLALLIGAIVARVTS